MLRFNGPVGSIISVTDDTNLIMLTYISPGGSFAVSGAGGQFSSTQILVSVNGVQNAWIMVTCDLVFDPNVPRGDFSIVNVVSNGRPVCCAPSSDVIKPVITGCADITANTTSSSTSCNVAVTWTPPQVSDCQLVSFTSVPASGSLFPIGKTTVVYTAKDINNNTATCSFKVTVKDATTPVATSCPSDITVIANPSTCKGTATWNAPAFTDNCGIVSLSNSSTPGEYPIGTTEVTYSAKDDAGNVGTCKFKVIVKDATPPVVSDCPSTITLNADQSCKAKATWSPPKFADNCGLTIENNYDPGDKFSVGRTTVTYSAKDNSGNVSSCSFDVVVKDMVAPAINNCPSDTTITISSGSSTKTQVSWVPPVATDQCSSIEFTSTHKPGDTFSQGITSVTYTAKDVSGNTTTCAFKVTIVFDEPELEIFQVITPDGNGVNDTWWIGNIDRFDNNKVVVVDRWGSVIYSATGYNNNKTVWNGENNSGTMVSTGTYFYTVTAHLGQKIVEKKGFIEVIR